MAKQNHEQENLLNKENTLVFRLRRIINESESLQDKQLINQQINRLNHVLGKEENLPKLRQWYGLEKKSLKAFLKSIHSHSVNEQKRGIVLEILEKIIIFLQTRFQDVTNPPEQHKNVPFAHVLRPFILVARQKLMTKLKIEPLSNGLALSFLDESAYLGLEDFLLQDLVKISVQTLQYEFEKFRKLESNSLQLEVESKPNNKAYYNAFVDKILNPNDLLAFFETYPLLAKLIAIKIDFWVESTGEFIERLQSDWLVIEQTFSHLDLNKITEIKAGLSDSHNGGRSVIALTFNSGLKLIYKPKNVGLEVTYNQILNWCNQQDLPLQFKILKTIDRNTYGWVEYIEQLPCENEEAAKRFYQRAGMQLSLLSVLGATDCHYENFIASGEHFVFIDMETLLQPEAKPLKDNPITSDTQIETETLNLNDSVLRTGLLPRWQLINNRIPYEISALGSVETQELPIRLPNWEAVNTDEMRLNYQTGTIPVKANVLILDGKALSPNDYLDELIQGFEQMYRLLMARRTDLLDTNSPWRNLASQRVRFIFRSTQIYGTILLKTLSPNLLRFGIDRSIELHLLSRAFLLSPNQPKAWPIFLAELQAMEQLDIPYFAAQANSEALSVGLQSPIEEYFKESSYSRVLRNLNRLSEADLDYQIAIISGAFQARIVRDFALSSVTEQETIDDLDVSLLTREQLIEKASQIAQKIDSQALKNADGSCNWLSLNPIPNTNRLQFMLMGNNLYDGRCGVALFLAALASVTGYTHFYDTALGAVESLQKSLSHPDITQKLAKSVGIGGAIGIGSMIYSLVKICQFLPEDETLYAAQRGNLLEDAIKLANVITLEVIAADERFDVMGGSAGAILGLLALYRETKETAVLEKAIACGHHLLEHRIMIDNQFKVWKTLDDALKPLTGFSHGAAGIAYALLRLYEVTENKAYLKAASEGIAYEKSVFSLTDGNWYDLRSFVVQNGQPSCQCSWCHGASGIGLARLGGLSILNTDAIRQDIEVALQTTQKYGVRDIDHLCCGNMGRVEVLLVAGQKLSDSKLFEEANQQAALIIARAEQTGEYRLLTSNLPKSLFMPGFFKGIAGIGYEMLRLASPDLLPSVLLWQ